MQSNLKTFRYGSALVLVTLSACGPGLKNDFSVTESLTTSLRVNDGFFVIDGTVATASERNLPFYNVVTVRLVNNSSSAIEGLTLSTGAHTRVQGSPSCLTSLAAGATCDVTISALNDALSEIEDTVTVQYDTETLATYTLKSENSVAPDLWFDPSDASTVFTDTACTTAATTSSTVACLKNKTGNSSFNFLQSTAINRPLLRASEGFNDSRNILLFDGSDDRLSASTDLRTTLGKVHAMGAFHRQVDGSGGTWQRFFSSCFWSDSTNDIVAPCFGFISEIGSTTGQPYAVSKALLEARVDTDTVRLRSMSFGINTRWGSEFLEGEMGEFVLYQQALSAESRQAIRDYFNYKWGTANQRSHPD